MSNSGIITVETLEPIKKYIDGVRYDVNNRIDNEVKNYITEKIQDAAVEIQSDYDSKHKVLEDKLAYLEQFGTEEEINKIKLQIEALEGNTQNKFEALEGLERELNRLSADYQELYDGVTTGTVFNAGQLDEIINTAFIKEVEIGKDSILTPEMLATKIVALIGNFGQINAANIVGGEISGHTIQSNNKIEGTDSPVWQIKDAGDGYLAQENIKWDVDGNVTFGPGVKITFDNVQGAEDKLKDLMSNYDDDLQKYVEEAVKTSAAGAISREELESRVQETKAAADEAIEILTNTVNLNKETIENDLQTKIDLVNQQIEQARQDGNDALVEELGKLKADLEEQLANVDASIQTKLNEAIDAVNANIDASYAQSSADLKEQYDIITEAYNAAIKAGDEANALKLLEIKSEVQGNINSINNEFSAVHGALDSVRGDITELKNTPLSPEDIIELLEAATVTSTEITDGKIKTPSLLAKKIVGLVGTFGTIKASQIVGTHIQGYTVSSPLDVKDENGNPVYEVDENGNPVYEQALNDNGTPAFDENGKPIYITVLDPNTGEYVPMRKKKQIPITEAAWVLNQDGSGHIANRNIRWEADGTVKLDPSVTIKWESVDGGKEYVDDVVNEIDQSIRGEFKQQLEIDITAAKDVLTSDIDSLNDTLSSKTADLEGQLNTTETTVSSLQSNYNDLSTTVKGIADTYVSQEGIFTGTIRSSVYEVNEDGTITSTPYWMLDYLGDGHLAKGNIKWDKNGNVTFGPDVTISWDAVDGAQDAVDGAINDAVGDIDTDAINKVATKIDANGVYTGTIKSNNSAWELKEDGSGYLANGGIKWGKNGGLLLKGAIKHKWKIVEADDPTNISAKQFTIDNNAVYEVDGEYIPTNSNFKIMTSPNAKNVVSLPTADAWDGTEITIMNNGNADLFLGNALISDTETVKGEISNPGTAITDSGLSYSIGAGALIQLIGVKDHFFKESAGLGQDVSWFTTSAGSSKFIRSVPLYIQFWKDSIIGDKVGPFPRSNDQYWNKLPMQVAICSYPADDEIPSNVIQFISPSNYMQEGIIDPITGVNYINAAPTIKTASDQNTLCAAWSNLNTTMSSWLFQDNVWNNLNSNTGYGKTYLEIYVKDLRDFGVTNGLTFTKLGIINYSLDEPKSGAYDGTNGFTASCTKSVPHFVDPSGENYWFKYRLKLSNLLTLLQAASTPVARMQSLSQVFNSKWDPEANNGNGNWVYSYKAETGPSKIGLIGQVLSQNSTSISRD